MHGECIAVSGGLGRVQMFDWATSGKGHVLLACHTSSERSSHRIGFCSKRPKDASGCVVRGICSSVRASKVLTYSSRGQLGMLPIQPGSDLPCRERGVGWDGPWLDERICKVQRHPWGEVESRSLQGDCSRLVETAADSPRAGHAGRRRPQEEEATSLMRSWWGQVIYQRSYCSVSDDSRRCLEPAASDEVGREPVLRNRSGSARWSSDQLDPVLCGTAVDQPWLLLKF